ncbi:DUF2129 domain-containing protein [Mycoplasmatota bacterium WC44]
MVNRKGFIVYFNSHKVAKEIENIANVTYISKKRKYLIAYCDAKRYPGYKSQIKKVKGVRTVLDSKIDLTNYSFEENISVK